MSSKSFLEGYFKFCLKLKLKINEKLSKICLEITTFNFEIINLNKKANCCVLLRCIKQRAKLKKKLFSKD